MLHMQVSTCTLSLLTLVVTIINLCCIVDGASLVNFGMNSLSSRLHIQSCELNIDRRTIVEECFSYDSLAATFAQLGGNVAKSLLFTPGRMRNGCVVQVLLCWQEAM